MGEEYKRSTDVFHLLPAYGDLLLFDDFESPIPKWAVSGTGQGNIESDPSVAFQDSQSLYLFTEAVAPLEDEWVRADRFIPSPTSLIMELLAVFRPGSATIGHYEFALDYCLGAESWRALIRYSPAGPTFQYLDDADAFQTLLTLDQALNPTASSFHLMRLAVNFSTKKFISAQLNEHSYSLAGIDINKPDLAITDGSRAIIQLTNSSAAANTMWADNLLIRKYAG